MSPTVIGLTLFAAVLHATWNAALRSGVDRLWFITVMSFATTVAAIPFALLLPLPLPKSWMYLGISAVLQVVYSVFLAHAYRYALLGVTLICLGIISLASGAARAGAKSVVLALATASLVASYVTADGIGVRFAGSAQSYAAWIFLIYGALMPLAFVLLRRGITVDLRSPETLKALAGGMVSFLSYGAITTALALGKVGPISALRETSIVFSALLGRVVLGEALTPRRILACMVVAVGAVCIGYAS
jgi:drug/metabolite transporter (DMT)-like permease